MFYGWFIRKVIDIQMIIETEKNITEILNIYKITILATQENYKLDILVLISKDVAYLGTALV